MSLFDYRQPSVLVVDDEIEVASTLKECLDYEYKIVEVASSSGEAIAKMKARHYNVIIVDSNLPNRGGPSGLELLEHIKLHYPDVAVIMTNSNNNAETRARALKLGAFDLIEKPFQIDTFLNRVANAISHLVLLEAVQSKLSDFINADNLENFYKVSPRDQIRILRNHLLAAK